MPLTVHFVRHGESQANLDRVFANRTEHESALTPAGVEQAEALARVLAPLGFAHLYTSPLRRARQTAEVLGATLRVDVTVSDALREYDVGEYEGLPYGGEHAWRWEAYERVDHAWSQDAAHERLPGGESLVDIEARFLPFIEMLSTRHGTSDRLVVVSHGGLYRTAFPALFADVSPDYTRLHSVGHCEAIIASWEDPAWRCLRWGDNVLISTEESSSEKQQPPC